MTSPQRVRIGVVGAGRYSNVRLLPELKKIPGVELVSVANSSQESSDRVAQEFGIPKAVADWREVVSSPDVDMVFNGTQAPQHHDILLAALENDKHILTLNPLAMTAEESRELVQAGDARPHLKLRSFLAFPAGPYTREDEMVRRLLASDEIGTVHQALFVWHTPFLAAGSYFEVLNRWLGAHKRILAVRKQVQVGDSRISAATVIAELHDGTLITYSHSTFVAEGARTPRVELYGEKGTLVVHGYPANVRESVFIAKGDDKTLQPVPIPADLSANWEDPRHLPVEEQYIQWVQGGPEPSPALLPFEEALKNMEFAEAFVASSRQDGIWVDMPQH